MNTEELNALKDRAYKTAVEHGFHEEEKPDAYWLGLVMSEMGEAINADRKGIRANIKHFELDMSKGHSFSTCFEWNIKDGVEDELADIVIRLLDFAGLKDICLNCRIYSAPTIDFALDTFEKSGMPGMLFYLIGSLYNSANFYEFSKAVCSVITIFTENFKKITGSDKALWYFVKKKMRYNELRPKLNGKKY